MVMAVGRVVSAWSADGHCSYPRQEQGSIDKQQLVCVCVCVCVCGYGKGGGGGCIYNRGKCLIASFPGSPRA